MGLAVGTSVVLCWLLHTSCNNPGQHVHTHAGQLSLAIPLRVGTMSSSQMAVTPCGWGVKAHTGMVCVWVACKTVWYPCYTRAIAECFRDKGLIIKCYINSSVVFTLHTCLWHSSSVIWCWPNSRDALQPGSDVDSSITLIRCHRLGAKNFIIKFRLRSHH